MQSKLVYLRAARISHQLERSSRSCCSVCLLIALLTSFIPPAAYGQGSAAARSDTGSIRAQIVPTHDHDMAQATASLPNLGIEVSISADGTFELTDIPPGVHVMVVRVPTLGVALQRVEVTANQTSDITVEITPNSHFEEVVVSVTGEIRDPLELANPVSVLSGEELMLRTEATLGETLANEAGVSSSFFGQGSSRPIIRGLAGDRVRMLEGGLGTGDASDVSVDHAVSTDPLQAERIEVLRGPSTLLYGSSAIGGAVNIIDERIPTTRASEPFSGTLDLRGGSVSNERVGSLSLNGGSEDWAWHANVMARDTDNYEIPGFARRGEEHHEGDDHEEEENPFGLLPNSDLESRGGRFGVTRFFGKSGFLGVAVSGFETEYGIPAGHAHEEEHQEHGDEQHGEEEGDENVRIDMDQQRVDLRGLINREFGIFRAVRVRVAANDYEHVELEGGERGTLFFNDYAEGRVELVQEERNGLTGTIGIQYADRDLESIGAESFIPPSQSERWALFAVEELERGDLTWQLGARFETQDSRATGQGSTSHDGLSGSLGLVYELTDTWSLAGSLSRSVKLPAPEELFANGPHLATLSFEIGDPQLTEEKGLGVDVSLRKTQGRVTGELTLFRQDFDDFVYQAFTGEEQDDLPVVVFRQANAEFLGAELTARVELIDLNGHHLHLRLVADTVEAELDAGGNLPRIPPASFGGGLHYHSERWNAMAEVRVIDDQTDVAVNETPTDGYTFVNASVGHRFIFGGRIVDLLLRGRNLTDEEGRVHTSFLKDQIVLPGRDVSLSARFWF